MKVMLTIVMLSVLVEGGAALECFYCVKNKFNGAEDSTLSFACDDKSKKKCTEEGQNACVIEEFEFTITNGTVSTKWEYTGHNCMIKSTEEAFCNESKKLIESQSSKDFTLR